jgi:hypothetical protein
MSETTIPSLPGACRPASNVPVVEEKGMPAVTTSPALHARSPFAVAMQPIAWAVQAAPLAAAVDRLARHEVRRVFSIVQRAHVDARVESVAALVAFMSDFRKRNA